MLSDIERARLKKAVSVMPEATAGRSLTGDDITEANSPARTVKTTTTSATLKTTHTIETASGRCYSVGYRARGWDATASELLFKESVFVYKNVGGTLTQVGSDADVISATQDATWAVSHTTSSTNILVQVKGDASNTTQWHVDVWVTEMTLVN